MEIGPEISNKIRSAIKAKLVELGAYVDEELPDYIMVMVANKKNRLQMTEDLNLFLGGNTDKFTQWLHNLLTKLQSLSADPGTEVKEETKDEKKDKERKKSTDRKKSSEVFTEQPKKRTEKSVSKDSNKDKSKPKEIEKIMTPPPEPEEPEFTVTADTDEFSEELKEIEKQAEAKKVAPAAAPAPAPVPAASVTVSTAPPAPTKTITVPVKTSPPTKPVTELYAPKESTVVSRPSASMMSRLGERRSDGRAVVSTERVTSIRRAVPRTSSVSLKRKAPSSVVTSLPVRLEDEEEEYDPHNPSVGSVASVIRVTDRKSSVPRSLQANKSLLMKAMTDAEKSITVGPKRSVAVADSRPGYVPRRTLYSDRVSRVIETSVPAYNPLQPSLTSRSKKHEIMRQMKYTIDVDSQSELTEEPASDEEVLPDNRVVQVDPEEEAEEEDVPVEIVTAVSDSEATEQENAVPLILAEDMGDEFQHVLEEEDAMVQIQHQQQQQQQLLLQQKQQQLLHQKQQQQQQQQQQVALQEDSENISSRIVKDSPKNTKFIVTLDGVDPQQYEDMDVDTDDQHNTSIVHQISPTISPPKVKNFSINLRDSDDEDGPSVTPLKRAKMTEKCRFWPACVNGNSCDYHHPTIPCKTFPSCKFGDKCLYIHPNCKYDARCTKTDCPFTHASRRKPIAVAPPQVIAIPQPKVILAAPSIPPPPSHPRQVICKFYPKCHNMKCPFKHPKPCRYGTSCAVKATCPFFHPALPSKEKMTWKSNKTTSRTPTTDGIKAS